MRHREAAFSVLLVLSGAAALLHESAWFRMLVPILGAGVLPAAAVSAGALLGLSIGAALGGRGADGLRRPALAFVLAEAAAAALALLVPPALRLLAPLDGAVGALAATLLLAVPAVPMGASLPAALRAVAPAREAVGACFRRLYAWNTVGAVGGVVAAATFLLEALGNRGAVRAASATEGAAALLGLALLGPSAAPTPAPAPALAPPRAAPPARRLVAAAFLAGAAGLVVQVAWTRRLTPVIGTTFQVFALVLAVQLLALALGSFLLGPRRGEGSTRALVAIGLAAAVPVALLPGAIGDVSRRVSDALLGAAGDPTDLFAVRLAIAAALVLPSTLAGAALLPWLVRAAAPDRERAGRGAGALLAANTAGSAVAALTAALAWIPSVGTAAALRGAAGLYLGAAALAATSRAWRAGLVVGALALVLQPWVLPLEDRAGRDAIGVFYDPARYDPAAARPVLFAEGRVTTVVVRDAEGRREFWVDGSQEASTVPTDRLHLGLLGHLPMALLAARGAPADRVTVIGLGAGFTSQAVASWGPKDLSIHEIEREVVAASRTFAPEGGGPPASARVTIGDGRRGLAKDAAPRDLVTSDPIHPSLAGSAFLYSLEHYERIVERLADDGLACQWLPLYAMVPDDLRLVVRTFAAAFPAPYLFLSGGDGILVGAKRPLVLSEARLRAALEGPGGEGLGRLGLRAPGRLLGLLDKDPAGCRSFAGEGPLNTDDRLLLEFRSGRHATSANVAGNAVVLGIGRAKAATLLDAPPSERFVAEAREADDWRRGLRAWLFGDEEGVLDVFGPRAEADPLDAFAAGMRDDALLARAWHKLELGAEDDAAAVARELLSRPGRIAALRLDAAAVLIEAGQEEEGRAVARAVFAESPWPRARRLAGDDPRILPP